MSKSLACPANQNRATRLLIDAAYVAQPNAFLKGCGRDSMYYHLVSSSCFNLGHDYLAEVRASLPHEDLEGLSPRRVRQTLDAMAEEGIFIKSHNPETGYTTFRRAA